jgi:hypothetical protein
MGLWLLRVPTMKIRRILGRQRELDIVDGEVEGFIFALR